MKRCKFEECERETFARQYCQGHYNQLRMGRELAPLRTYRKTNADGTKACSKCEVGKPWSEYYQDSTSICKECRKAKNRRRTRRLAQADALWAAVESGEIELTEDAKRIVEALR